MLEKVHAQLRKVSQARASSNPPAFFPTHSSLLLLAFPNIFSLQISVLQLAAGRAHAEGMAVWRFQLALPRTLVFHCVLPSVGRSHQATVPGEIPARAEVEDGSSGGNQLSREKGERKTCVVFPAFTLAERNGCKSGAGGTAFRVLEDQPSPPEPRQNTWYLCVAVTPEEKSL